MNLRRPLAVCAAGFSRPGNARQEAVRGTFDSAYLFYSISELMTMKLHDNRMTHCPQELLPVTLVRATPGDAERCRLLH